MKNSRLVAGPEGLTPASPGVLTIEAVDRLLVTRVLTRPLCLGETQLRRM